MRQNKPGQAQRIKAKELVPGDLVEVAGYYRFFLIIKFYRSVLSVVVYLLKENKKQQQQPKKKVK